jgi:hypothetical protein
MPRMIVSIFQNSIETKNVPYQNDLKEHFLVDLHEFLIPLLNISSLLACVILLVLSGRGIISVVFAPFNNLAQDRLVYLEYL